jgi:hypothetical protein
VSLTVSLFQNEIRDKVRGFFSFFFSPSHMLALSKNAKNACSRKKKNQFCIEKVKKIYNIFRMLKPLNVNLRFIGSTLKKNKETSQVQPIKKTGRKHTVQTNEVVKKVRKRIRKMTKELKSFALNHF